MFSSLSPRKKPLQCGATNAWLRKISAPAAPEPSRSVIGATLMWREVTIYFAVGLPFCCRLHSTAVL